jgi:hypothetical protein|tara:strand:- start:3989 stop:4639 length:651 start_codon:yes stop_codon:yes gene_type:complete
MSFTFTTLKTTIQDYTENTETTFVNNLPTLIKQAESRINSSVELPRYRKNQTATATINNQYLGVPDDFLYSYSLAVLDSDGNYSFLINKDVNFIREAYPKPSANTGLPEYYAQFDDGFFILGPTPDANYEVELHYFYLPQSITASSDGTSWLGSNAPDVLLFGSLVEAYIFMKGEPDLVSLYETRFKEALDKLVVEQDGRNRKDAYRGGQRRIAEQ